MGLAIRIDKGKYIPVMVCDSCGDAVEDWHMAVVTHSLKPNTGVIPVLVYHKGNCDQGGVGGARRLADSGWMQLDHYLPWLIWNHKWGRKFQSSHEGESAKLAMDVPDPFDW